MSPLRKGQKVEQLLSMSSKELSRLEVIQRLEAKRLRQREAAELLGVGIRQVKRLWRAYRQSGAQGLVSKRRGCASPNQLDEKVKRKALELLRGKYRGFGPTLACEKLVEVEGLKISDESVRGLMIVEGLWKARKARKPGVHQMRERRACFGELIQIDGSPHAWLEERGPYCTLLVLIDDATGELLGLLFVDQESFHNYARLVHLIWSATASLWPSTVTNTVSSGSLGPLAQTARLRPNLDEPCRIWISRFYVRIRPRLKDASSGSTRPCKTAW